MSASDKKRLRKETSAQLLTEKQLQQIQEKIDQERQRLRNLHKATSQLRELETDLATTRRYLQYVERKAKAIAEAADL